MGWIRHSQILSPIRSGRTSELDHEKTIGSLLQFGIGGHNAGQKPRAFDGHLAIVSNEAGVKWI
ncbi:hypothetical protein V1279_006568 [Bradyrhizobium sp. AZCC 1610]